MAHKHLFSNRALHECETPLFQGETGVRGKGFLCHYQGIVWKMRLRRLESKILPPLGPCPPPLPDGHQRPAGNQTNGFLALACPAFHCLGGAPRGRVYKYRLCAVMKKNLHVCLLHKEHEKA